MSESCNHNCGSCSESNCGERQEGPAYEPLNAYSNVKKVIGVVSGKGGVGKSLVTSLSAITMAQQRPQNRHFRCRYHRAVHP